MATTDDSNCENAKTLFDAAVQFTLAEGIFVWSRFSAVMVAQSIVAFVFGQAFFTALTETNSTNARILALVFAFVLIVVGRNFVKSGGPLPFAMALEYALETITCSFLIPTSTVFRVKGGGGPGFFSPITDRSQWSVVGKGH